jgi:hypothetical protein
MAPLVEYSSSTVTSAKSTQRNVCHLLVTFCHSYTHRSVRRAEGQNSASELCPCAHARPENAWALQMIEELDKDLHDLLCDIAHHDRLVHCMVKHSVTSQSDQEGVLAEATMSYNKIRTLESELKNLREEHKQLQQEHTKLKHEVAMDQAQRNDIRVALQNLACAPFDSMRRGFEMHRILYGSRTCETGL